MTMEITIKATDQVTNLDGVPVRLWEGTTSNGTPCKVFVHRIAAYEHLDCSEFERELQEKLPPGRHIPLSSIL